MELFDRLIAEDKKTRFDEGASDEDTYSDDEPATSGPPPPQTPVDSDDEDSFNEWLVPLSLKRRAKGRP